MAEIRIEQRRRSVAWLWILLVVLVLAAAAWYLYYQRGVRVSDAARGTPAAPATVRASTTTPAINGLVYARSRRARRRPIAA